MCADCWNAAAAVPTVAVGARFAWIGYRDKIPFVARRRRERAHEPAAYSSGETSDRASETVPAS